MKTHAFIRSLATVCALPFAAAVLMAQPSAAGEPAEAIYDLTAVDKAPELKRRIKPDYPSSVRKRATPGEITLRFIVTAKGNVTDITIVKFNDPEMVGPVFSAYTDARFTPGLKAGSPVNTRLEVTEIFPAPKPPRSG